MNNIKSKYFTQKIKKEESLYPTNKKPHECGVVRKFYSSSSLESDLVLFRSFVTWDKAAPRAIPIPIPKPRFPVPAPIATPIATPIKNLSSPLISKSTHHLIYKQKTPLLGGVQSVQLRSFDHHSNVSDKLFYPGQKGCPPILFDDPLPCLSDDKNILQAQ